MPSPTLPEECLWLIVHCLKDDRAALHSLLCTSKILFRIAVHYLYRSPFRILDQDRDWHWSLVERTKRWDHLLHVLLHSSKLLLIPTSDSRYSVLDGYGHNSINTFLPRYGPEVLPLPSPSTVDYLSYCTDMFHEPMIHQTFMTLFPTVPNCYHANVIWYRSMIYLRSRIELAMFKRLAPQLASLTIAMGIQVPRIQVPFLSSLRRLEIAGTDYCLLSDRDLDLEADGHTWRVQAGRRGVDPRSVEDYAMTKLDRVLVFIWDHQRIHGTLRELKIDLHEVSPASQPSNLLIELVEAMGDTLEVLDVQFWPLVVHYLDRIPTRNLKSLLLPLLKDPEPYLEQSRTVSAFFGQCPRLDTIRMYTRESNLLESWRPRIGQQGLQDSSLDSITPRLDALSLVDSSLRPVSKSKLRNISIAGLAQDVIAVVNEATSMFASELESMAVRSWFNGRLMTSPVSWSNSDVLLDRLWELNLEGEVCWTFDYGSLLKCPRLSRVRLAFTGPMPSRSAKKQPAIGLLAQVSTLKDLELVGHWETLDNKGWPSVVSKISRLERLDLKSCEGITADQVFRLVLAAVENSRQQQEMIQEEEAEEAEGKEKGEGVKEMRKKSQGDSSPLRFVILNKRVEDALARLRHIHQRLALQEGKPEVGSRVHYSFVVTARPSH
ncbi:hypothetical protein BGZ83_001779 [Gryganskiella cystojenkinii]|nr:hypothetical protein BGZ83_001779 [Gryganskiella cystojenkinii]